MKDKLREPTLSVSIRTHIKNYIIDNNLKAGDSLPSEGQFATELGVSRSPIREAVKALQSLGIVEVRHGEGLFVRELNFDPVAETMGFGMQVSPDTLAELYQIRKWLEMAVITEVVEVITDDEIMQLDILMLQWERAMKAGDDYIQYDEAFHQIILGTMHNETLLKLFKAFWLAFKNYEDANLYSPELDRVLAEHQNVVDAIKTRDPDLARQALHDQFLGFQDRIRQLAENADKKADSDDLNNSL